MSRTTLTVTSVDFRVLPEHVREIITTPHAEECAERWPVWLIMIDRGDGWELHSVASTADSAAYLYMSAGGGIRGNKVFVERVPVDHAFGSRMLDMARAEGLVGA